MRVLSWEEFLSGGFPHGKSGYAGSVGSFDGVHLGHRKLLATLKERSTGLDGCAVITFRENPKRILRPEHYPGDISSLQQRLEMIEAGGMDVCVLISYDKEFGSMTGRDFLEELIRKTGLASLIMGQNARLGAHAAMDSHHAVSYARELGVKADILPSLVCGEKTISSSRIRAAILSGNVDEVKSLLGYPYELDLEGWKIQVQDGAFAMQQPEKRQLLPPSGEYRTESLGAGGMRGLATLEVLPDGAGMRLSGADGLPLRLRFV